GVSHPDSASASSTARFAGWSSSSAYVDASTSGATRPHSATAGAGSSKWFSEKHASTASNAPAQSGNDNASLTAQDGRAARPTSNISWAMSDAITRAPAARAAREPTPVPDPRSRTSRPSSGEGLNATSALASGPYTRAGPAAHAAAPAPYASATAF